MHRAAAEMLPTFQRCNHLLLLSYLYRLITSTL
nr:MAG TPA_asm: hypothetical protein [Caudoviricetes sp.]